jgi:hypothetical protein
MVKFNQSDLAVYQSEPDTKMNLLAGTQQSDHYLKDLQFRCAPTNQKSKIENRKLANASNTDCLSPLPPDDRGEC